MRPKKETEHELAKWINKDLASVSNSELFRKYFDGIEIRQDEGVSYISNKEMGIDLVLREDNIESIHLFSGNYDSSKKFEGNLPFNLEFSFYRLEIKDLFGEANKTGGGTMIFFSGITGMG